MLPWMYLAAEQRPLLVVLNVESTHAETQILVLPPNFICHTLGTQKGHRIIRNSLIVANECSICWETLPECRMRWILLRMVLGNLSLHRDSLPTIKWILVWTHKSFVGAMVASIHHNSWSVRTSVHRCTFIYDSIHNNDQACIFKHHSEDISRISFHFEHHSENFQTSFREYSRVSFAFQHWYSFSTPWISSNQTTIIHHSSEQQTTHSILHSQLSIANFQIHSKCFAEAKLNAKRTYALFRCDNH